MFEEYARKSYDLCSSNFIEQSTYDKNDINATQDWTGEILGKLFDCLGRVEVPGLDLRESKGCLVHLKMYNLQNEKFHEKFYYLLPLFYGYVSSNKPFLFDQINLARIPELVPGGGLCRLHLATKRRKIWTSVHLNFKPPSEWL